ncbi:MAG: cryptochrome/photolyase family protein [Phenylobacterium sp.]
MPASLLWFRRDLRLIDNPALMAALSDGPVIPVYILDEDPQVRPLGGASRWWLNKSLDALSADLEGRGSRLILRRGDPGEVLSELAAATGAASLHWNDLFDPGLRERDDGLERRLKSTGVTVGRWNGVHLVRPDTVRTRTGGAFSVFTPFWRSARPGIADPGRTPAPETMPPAVLWPASEALADWNLHPASPDWSAGFSDWRPGEAGARERLAGFLSDGLSGYSRARDFPAQTGVSRLSPHLHFGEISPFAAWRGALNAVERGAAPEGDAEKFLAELGWREFNAAISNRGADLARTSFDRRFEAVAWRRDPEGLAAWRRGRTGYPIVDAGMRELWTTGWMHNRVRMICASFLAKHLFIDWREGEAWFWDTLVDADHASNAGNWQWVAGSGADAAPYFRIFSPMAQGAKFDPDGRYVRKWVPELARLPDKWLHAPWTAAPLVLDQAGVRLGRDYPAPVVDHDFARARALEAYAVVKGR